jgi:hypothetical protein
VPARRTVFSFKWNAKPARGEKRLYCSFLDPFSGCGVLAKFSDPITGLPSTNMLSVRAAVELVAARLGGHIHDTTGIASVLGAVAVGLDAELRNRVRAGNHIHQVAQGGVVRDAVVVNHSLFAKPPPIW